MKEIKPEDTRKWLREIAYKALREYKNDKRREDFRQILERVRRLSR